MQHYDHFESHVVTSLSSILILLVSIAIDQSQFTSGSGDLKNFMINHLKSTSSRKPLNTNNNRMGTGFQPNPANFIQKGEPDVQTPSDDRIFFPPYKFPFWGLPYGIYSKGGFFNPGLFPFVPGGPAFPPFDGIFGGPFGPGQFPGPGPTPFKGGSNNTSYRGGGQYYDDDESTSKRYKGKKKYKKKCKNSCTTTTTTTTTTPATTTTTEEYQQNYYHGYMDPQWNYRAPPPSSSGSYPQKLTSKYPTWPRPAPPNPYGYNYGYQPYPTTQPTTTTTTTTTPAPPPQNPYPYGGNMPYPVIIQSPYVIPQAQYMMPPAPPMYNPYQSMYQTQLPPIIPNPYNPQFSIPTPNQQLPTAFHNFYSTPSIQSPFFHSLAQPPQSYPYFPPYPVYSQPVPMPPATTEYTTTTTTTPYTTTTTPPSTTTSTTPYTTTTQPTTTTSYTTTAQPYISSTVPHPPIIYYIQQVPPQTTPAPPTTTTQQMYVYPSMTNAYSYWYSTTSPSEYATSTIFPYNSYGDGKGAPSRPINFNPSPRPMYTIVDISNKPNIESTTQGTTSTSTQAMSYEEVPYDKDYGHEVRNFSTEMTTRKSEEYSETSTSSSVTYSASSGGRSLY